MVSFDDSEIPYVDPEEEKEIMEILRREMPKIIEEIKRGEYITGEELLKELKHKKK